MENNDQPAIELSVVLPCLNEADTLATCIAKAQSAFKESDCIGEIVVADNGSEDGSPEIATALGARVIHVAERGYGSALMAGIGASRGRFVIMGDADDSYDFLEIPKFLSELRAGHDLVQGCRLPTGGGRVLPGAMPQVLSRLTREIHIPLIAGGLLNEKADVLAALGAGARCVSTSDSKLWDL